MPAEVTIKLNNGRLVDLQEIKQCLTYEGLLEGFPLKIWNDKIIKSAIESAKCENRGVEPYLIEPVIQAIEWDEEKPYPFGPPEALPDIECEARFKSFQPARDPQCDYSWLVVVWFQPAFALPIDEQIVEQIKTIDWETLASDDYY